MAAGQARRAAEIRAALAAWQALQMRAYDETLGIQLGALIWLGHAGGGQQCLLLGPDGAGLKLQHDGQEITLITPHAPLGRQLLGQGPGDQVQAATQAWEVLRVE